MTHDLEEPLNHTGVKPDSSFRPGSGWRLRPPCSVAHGATSSKHLWLVVSVTGVCLCFPSFLLQLALKQGLQKAIFLRHGYSWVKIAFPSCAGFLRIALFCLSLSKLFCCEDAWPACASCPKLLLVLPMGGAGRPATVTFVLLVWAAQEVSAQHVQKSLVSSIVKSWSSHPLPGSRARRLDEDGNGEPSLAGGSH